MQDPRTFTTTFHYDGRNRLYEVNYPVASGSPVQKKTFGYDANGNKTSETDENGHTTNYTYDGLNRLTATTRLMATAPNLVMGYGYNAVNSRTSVTDPRGLTTATDYDALQRPIDTVDALQQTTLYDYDGPNAGASAFDSSAFKPTTVTDPRGHTVVTTYDELYRPTQVVSSATPLPAGVTESDAVTLHDYDNVGNVRHSTDPAGHQTEMTYDALNRAVRVSYADGTSTQMLYTSTGLKWKAIDELLQATEMHYDGAGRMVETYGPPPDPTNAPDVRPLSRTGYDANGNVNVVIGPRFSALADPSSRETVFVFDRRNRKTDEWQPAVEDYDSGQTLRPHLAWEYDSVGNVKAIVDARGNRTETLYDWANRPYQVTAPSVPVILPDGSSAWRQPVTSTVYDENGHVLTLTDANGHTTTNTYDQLNRLGTTKDDEQDKVTYGYDAAGNRTSVQDANIHTTLYGYDGLNRNVTATDAAGVMTKFTYGDGLNKTKRVDGNGNTTLYDLYDQRNRLKHVTYVDHAEQNRTYDYDAAGRLRSVVDDNGNTATAVSYIYDGLGRVLTETSNGATHAYGYDLAGNRTSTQYGLMGGGAGRTLTSSYDALNRLTSLVDGSSTTTYHYDLDGHVRGKDLPSGEKEVTSYDALSRQSDSVDASATGTSLYAYTYGHDAGGNLRLMSEYKPGLSANTRTTVMSYDGADRLTGEAVYNGASAAPASLVSDTVYAYDAAGNRTSTRVNGNAPSSLTYNNLNQVTSYNGISYGYDANGNRTSRTVSVGNTLPSGTSVSGTATASPSISSFAPAFGPVGEVVVLKGANFTGTTAVSMFRNVNVTSFRVDSDTQITLIVPPGATTGTIRVTNNVGANVSSTKFSVSQAMTTYLYDLENRLSQVMPPALVGAGTVPPTYAYAYDYRTRRVGRTEGSVSTAVVFSGGTSIAEYPGGGSTGPTVEFVRGSDWGGGVGGILYSVRGGNASFDHYNARGDVSTQTSGTGTVSCQAEYEAWGKRTQEYGQDQDRQRANTKEEDPTGLLCEGRRYRDLETGSFLTRDPAGMVDGPNLYAYVRQNPWTKFDPEGLKETVITNKQALQLKDSASEINKFVNAMIQSVMADAKKNGWTPGLATDKLYQRLVIPSGQFGNDTNIAMQIAKLGLEYYRPATSAGSRYEGGLPFLAEGINILAGVKGVHVVSGVRFWDDDAVLAGGLNINGQAVGTDKLDHIFFDGYEARKNRDEALARKFSEDFEKGTNGLKMTGVFSRADIEANMIGVRFYNEFEKAVTAGKPFVWDITKIDTSVLNENINRNDYSSPEFRQRVEKNEEKYKDQ